VADPAWPRRLAPGASRPCRPHLLRSHRKTRDGAAQPPHLPAGERVAELPAIELRLAAVRGEGVNGSGAIEGAPPVAQGWCGRSRSPGHRPAAFLARGWWRSGIAAGLCTGWGSRPADGRSSVALRTGFLKGRNAEQRPARRLAHPRAALLRGRSPSGGSCLPSTNRRNMSAVQTSLAFLPNIARQRHVRSAPHADACAARAQRRGSGTKSAGNLAGQLPCDASAWRRHPLSRLAANGRGKPSVLHHRFR